MSLTALIVDDEPEIIQLLEWVVYDLGWNTLRALNGLEALAVMAKITVDIIITDIRMPNIDGLQLLTELILPTDKSGGFLRA